MAVVPLRGAADATYDPRTLALIRRTVAAGCSDDEFNLFVHTARHLGLDPLRRQIYAVIDDAGRPGRRRMAIITGIDGFRTIAARSGNYRPDETAPTFKIDPNLKGAANPAGLVKATVRVFKFSHGAWHKVTAVAHWDEYAPVRREAEASDWIDTGEAWPESGRAIERECARGALTPRLDPLGNWARMPRLMLAKVAEALALRKAWPEDFANVYASEEVDRSRAAALLPSEGAKAGATEERLARIGGVETILIDWMDNQPLCGVPVGQFADRVMAFLRENASDPSAVSRWTARNRHALREFWARAPGDALELKKHVEMAGAASRGVDP